MTRFFDQVYDVVERIPRGKVVSYGQIAYMIGRLRAAREVGRAKSYFGMRKPSIK